MYNAFGTPYTLDDFPMLLKSAPPGQYIGNAPVVEFDGDTATGVQHYVFVDQTTHEMRLAWYDDEYVRTADGWRIHRALHHVHASQRRRSTPATRTTRRASSPAKRSSRRPPCASAS